MHHDPRDRHSMRIFVEIECKDCFDLFLYTSPTSVSADAAETNPVVVLPVDRHMVDVFVDCELRADRGAEVARIVAIAEVGLGDRVIGAEPMTVCWVEGLHTAWVRHL